MRLTMISTMQGLQRQLLITQLLPLFLMLPMMSHAATAKEAPVARPALTVNVIQAQRITLPIKVFANGNIAAWQEAIIGSEANGLRLTQVHVNVGDTVSKGQLLAEFSEEAVLADLNQAKAKLMEAEAQGHEALANAERARTLQNTGAMSSQQIDQYLTAADTAKARVEVAKAVVQTQQIQLKNTKIYAPDSGVISARTATVGAVISAGSELFRLIRQSRLEWRAEVVSSDIAKVKVGMQVNITAADGSKFSGKVRKLSPTVDMQTRNSLIYVDLPPNNTAKAGMYAKGEFVSGQSSALAIPQQALVLRDGFTYVFVVKSEQGRTIVKQMKVQPGRRLLNLVEIVSGLQAQQSVVALGGAFLSDNDVVKVVSAISIKK
ncbi:MAG: efflux RND transporter periplasmic adaptor subunit [Methylophilaceae bacterium]